MGRIREPPKPTGFKHPVSGEWCKGTVLTWVKELKQYPDADWTYVIELIEWDEGGQLCEIRLLLSKEGFG